MSVDNLPGGPGSASTGTDAAAVITLPAVVGIRHVIPGIMYSYSDVPTGGRLTIEDNGVVVFDIDITTDGPGFPVKFDPHMRSAPGVAMVITLFGGGAGITGKLNIIPAPYTQG